MLKNYRDIQNGNKRTNNKQKQNWNKNGIETCARDHNSARTQPFKFWNVYSIFEEFCARKETTKPICLFIYYYSFTLNPQTIDRSFSASYSDALKLFVLLFCERVVVVVVFFFSYFSMFNLHLFPSFSSLVWAQNENYYYIRFVWVSEWVSVAFSSLYLNSLFLLCFYLCPLPIHQNNWK